MSHRTGWRIGLAVVVVAAVAGAGLALRSPPTRPALNRPEFESPRISPSPFLNTSPSATYVGIRVCAECHPAEHETYRATAHSLALAEVDSAAEPADASFYHAPSNRTYTIHREGDSLHHREAAGRNARPAIVETDYPVRFLIGSGRHTRSYLVDDQGFLVESPITWYQSRRKWDMSPGYHGTHHAGFERAADVGCLVCHVGRLDQPDASYQHVRITEQPIGCERCHGPGSLHAAEETAIREGGGRRDPGRPPTIVNPARLTRDLVESICAQCHLRGDATVIVRGRGTTDFRPGLPLADFLVNYHLAGTNSTMKVVGHIEQMRQSRCYQASRELSCGTCHPAHAPPRGGQIREHYIQACLACHAETSCGLDRDVRLRRNPRNDCVSCHMPQVETDIPHIAFTHHRIGVHQGDDSSPGRDPFAELVPFDDISHFSEIDRDRNLGLAYLEVSRKQNQSAAIEFYLTRATTLLNRVRSLGLSDPEVTSALAQISWETDRQTACDLAREALKADRLSARARVNCLFVVGDAELALNQIDEARQALEQLVTLRRLSEDWVLLSECRRRSGDAAAALRDLKRAAEIAPFRTEIHSMLARVHEQLGDRRSAENERETAEELGRRMGRK